MLHKTRGIVLRTTKYGDTSVIVKIYTEQFGVQSYIVNGVRSAKSKGKASLYQHGNLLEMVVYYKEQGSLFRISECRYAHVYERLPFDVVRSALMLFYIELLNRLLREQDAHASLFDFLFSAFIDLDQTDRPLGNHHIWFLLGLCKYLGFYPEIQSGIYFDMREGEFVDIIPHHENFLTPDQTMALRSCMQPELRNYDQLHLTSAMRKTLLHRVLQFYKLHISDFGDLRSLDVLESVFRQD